MEIFVISKNKITYIEPEVAVALADLPNLYRVVYVLVIDMHKYIVDHGYLE